MESIHQRKSSNEEQNPDPEQALESQDDEKKMKEDGMSGSMTENVYSLIYIADSTSAAFWISMLCVAIQFLMVCLVLKDLIQIENAVNPFGVPNNVSTVVRIAGFASLLFSVALFWDLMDAIDKLVLDRVALEHQIHRRRKFYFAFTLQLAIGTLFLITIFILIVQSTDVLGMFLNYAALQFITEVDDIAFKLAALGYVGNSMKKECENVTDFKLPPAKRPILRRIIYYSVTILLFIGYSSIWVKQINGSYDCKRIEVQFGDGFMSYLPVFSGQYTHHAEFHDHRPIYKDETGKAIFRYCYGGGSGYWVFGWFSPVTRIGNMDDLCTNFVSRTPQTSGFGILDTPGSNWLVKNEVGAKLENSVDYFLIRCADCDETTCNGSCQDKVCVCGENQYGNKCQFKVKPCGMVDYDLNFNPLSGIGYFFSSKYALLEKSDGEPASKYGRPLYTYFHPDGYADILMNMGRRYAITTINASSSFPNATNIHFELANYLEDVHPWYTWWEVRMLALGGAVTHPVLNRFGGVKKTYIGHPFFVSSPIDVGTPTDSLSPLGLTWSRTDHYANPLTPDKSLSTVLICVECSDAHRCHNVGGTCDNETNTCNCTSGYEGPMCEKEPSCVLTGTCR